jgi:hypothetical protein
MRWQPAWAPLVIAVAGCGGSSVPSSDAQIDDPEFAADQFAPWAGGPAYYASWPAGLSSDPAFFPIAVWLQAPIPNGDAYKAIGVNTFIEMSWGGLDDANLDAVEAAGLHATHTQVTSYATYVGRSGLVGWNHQDEPDNAQPLQGGGYGSCIKPAEIATRYAAMRTNDATRPVYLNLSRGVADESWVGRGNECSGHDEDYPLYAAATDIVSFDVYPVNDRLPRELVAHGVDRLRGWAMDTRPVWTWIETTRMDGANPHPGPADIRAEVWMALVHGAAGIGYFCHVFSPTFIEAGLLADSENAAAVGAIDATIQTLAQVLNTHSVTNGVTVTTTASVPVDTMLKRYGGATYVFAVAMRGTATTATFSLRDFPPTASATVLDENRAIDVTGGVFSDAFEPYAVHLYKITYP